MERAPKVTVGAPRYPLSNVLNSEQCIFGVSEKCFDKVLND